MKLARLLVLSLIVLGSTAAFAQASPVIVARVTLLNQTNVISQTPIFTPSASGVYRISSYMLASGPAGSPKWYLSLSWTDDAKTESVKDFLYVPVFSNNNLWNQDIRIVRAAAGTPINYKVILQSPTSVAYNLFITVEQLESDQ